MHKQILILLIAGSLFFSGCGKKTVNKQGNITKDEQQVVTVISQPVQLQNLEEYIEVTGKLEGNTDINMSSETSGKIVSLSKRLGDWVNIKEEIGRVDNEAVRIRFEQAKSALSSAEIAKETADLNMKSAENLYKANSISAIEYKQATIALKGAQANLEGAQANLEAAKQTLNNSKLEASASGYITDLPLKVGQYISPGMPVCTIVDSKMLIIKTGVGETDIKKVKKGQNVIVRYSNYPEIYNGTIRGVGIKPLSGTATYPVEIQLNNQQNKLLPGMVINAKILSNTYRGVVYTSYNNVRKIYDKNYVFIINNNVAEQREVELGVAVNENVILAKGVKTGERLVIEGSDNLENGTKVTEK